MTLSRRLFATVAVNIAVVVVVVAVVVVLLLHHTRVISRLLAWPPFTFR